MSKGKQGGANVYGGGGRSGGGGQAAIVEMLLVGASRHVNNTTVTTDHLVRSLGGRNVGTGLLIHSGRASRVSIISLSRG